MPTADGQFKGISLSGNAGEVWDRIFGQKQIEVPHYTQAARDIKRAHEERK